jgi:predicted Zn-dependent peptidase
LQILIYLSMKQIKILFILFALLSILLIVLLYAHALGPKEYKLDNGGYINSITKEDVLSVAKKYIDPENYVLVIVANQKKAGLKY